MATEINPLSASLVRKEEPAEASSARVPAVAIPRMEDLPALIRSVEEMIAEHLPGQEEASPFKTRNLEVLQGLKDTFGGKVFAEIWNRFSAEDQEKFLSGKEDLDAYREDFSLKAHQAQHGIYVESVMAKYPDCVESLKSDFPEAIVRIVFQKMSDPILESFLKEEDSPRLYMEELRAKARQIQGTIERNKGILGELEEEFSPDIVHNVIREFSSQERKQVREGSLSLERHRHKLEERCQFHARAQFDTTILPSLTTIGRIPSEMELESFFRSAVLVDFKSAAQGAFFFEGKIGDDPISLVVKIPDKARQETFGTHVLSLAGIKTPSFTNIPMSSPITEGIAHAVRTSRNREAVRAFKPDEASSLTIMTYIPGTTLEDLKTEEIARASSAHERAAVRLLEEIGEVGGADFLLFYRDRLPIMSGGNKENLMILRDEESLPVSAVAIDQPAYFSSNDFACRMLGIDPIEFLRSKITDIFLEGEEGPSTVATSLWENLPVFHDLMSEEEGIATLQRGLQRGLRKVAGLSHEQIDLIYANLPPGSSERDRVDRNIYHTLLEKIQTSLPK